MKIPNPKDFEDIDGDIEWYEFWQYVCKNRCDKGKFKCDESKTCNECKTSIEKEYYE